MKSILIKTTQDILDTLKDEFEVIRDDVLKNDIFDPEKGKKDCELMARALYAKLVALGMEPNREAYTIIFEKLMSFYKEKLNKELEEYFD